MKLRNKKTGKIIETNGDANAITVWRGYGENPSYKSIKELLENWEDYEESSENYMEEKSGVIEPLIKDEKIRKAVKAWAEACCIEDVEITHSRKCILRIMDAITNNDEICIDREIGQTLEEKVYTITELCGEEE